MEADRRERLMQMVREGDKNALAILMLERLEKNEKDGQALKVLVQLSEDSPAICHVTVKKVHGLRAEQYYDEMCRICKKWMEVSETALVDLAVFFQKGWMGMERDIDLAIGLFEKAIRQFQSGISCQSIGAIYYYGDGTPQDLERAIAYFKQGAQFRYGDCEVSLGNLYLNGEGVPRSCSMASYWYERAFEDGRRDVAMLLGNLYNPENHLLDDADLAFQWYHNGALWGDSQCALLAGLMCEDDGDYGRAFSYYQQAADQGSEIGCLSAGSFLLYGTAGVMNPEAARFYLQHACEMGCKEAVPLLKQLEQTGETGTADCRESDGYSGVYLSSSTFTGAAEIKDKYARERAQKQAKDSDMLRHVAAATGTGGQIMNGMLMGYGEQEDLFVMGDTVFSSSGKIYHYDPKMNYVYDYEKKETTMLYDLGKDGIYNGRTGKMSYTFGRGVAD